MSKIHKIQTVTFILISVFIMGALFFSFSSPCVAAEKKPEARSPIDITSDSLEATGADIIFIGNVHAVYGDMTIDADRVQIFYETEKSGEEKSREIKTIIATGKVELIEKDRHAWAGKMVYDRASDVATLTDNPRIKQETNTISGDFIKVFFAEDKVDIKGNVKAIVNSGTIKD